MLKQEEAKTDGNVKKIMNNKGYSLALRSSLSKEG